MLIWNHIFFSFEFPFNRIWLWCYHISVQHSSRCGQQRTTVWSAGSQLMLRTSRTQVVQHMWLYIFVVVDDSKIPSGIGCMGRADFHESQKNPLLLFVTLLNFFYCHWFRQACGNHFLTGGRGSRSKIKFYHVTWYADFHPTPWNRADWLMQYKGKGPRCKW